MKQFLLISFMCGASMWASGQSQLSTQLQLPSNLHPKALLLKASIPVGNSHFALGSQMYPLQIQGTLSNQTPISFTHENVGESGYMVNFSLYEHEMATSAQSLEEKYGKEYWKVLLHANIPTDLDLSFGLGSASLNLSDLAVSHVNMRTGKANVSLKYDEGKANATEMNIFDAKVDMGNMAIERLNLSKARTFQAEIGVGALSISFSNQIFNAMSMLVNVGAGSLYVALPSDQSIPISIKIDDSMLSVVTIPKHFQKSNGVYANQASLDNPSGKGLSFDITVSVGTVTFGQ